MSAIETPSEVRADIRLAATLGPKTKRITRKQLIGVDLTKTCELIAEPPEPLALRLSGCLLVGVARSAACTLICHELTIRVYNQNYDLFYTVRPFDF
jgi:meiotic recombination protein REC8